MRASPMIHLKRIYDEASAADGKRVLVDRLWPRGILKKDAMLDEWCKQITPSNDLRKWFHENPEDRWPEFRDRYATELHAAKADLDRLADIAAGPGLTLLTAAKDREHNHTVVLKDILEDKL